MRLRGTGCRCGLAESNSIKNTENEGRQGMKLKILLGAILSIFVTTLMGCGDGGNAAAIILFGGFQSVDQPGYPTDRGPTIL